MILTKQTNKQTQTNKKSHPQKIPNRQKPPKQKCRRACWQKIFLYTQSIDQPFFPLCPKDSTDVFPLCFHPRFPPWLQERDKHRTNSLNWLPYFALKLLNNHFEWRDEQKETRNSFLEFLKINCFLFSMKSGSVESRKKMPISGL